VVQASAQEKSGGAIVCVHGINVNERWLWRLPMQASSRSPRGLVLNLDLEKKNNMDLRYAKSPSC
jgi:hypothetical protein